MTGDKEQGNQSCTCVRQCLQNGLIFRSSVCVSVYKIDRGVQILCLCLRSSSSTYRCHYTFYNGLTRCDMSQVLLMNMSNELEQKWDIYICVCVYTCECIYIYVQIYICVCACIYIYIYMLIHTN